ncbi:MAG TPA: hypothetical protein VK735_39310 [Pseudonocardia sp.]|jgi:hypothetical protein|uniref:DUF7660 family protein n=1 Tax=Pseudonocardia sp. TaxID=60912 RepID=UPI002C8A11FA|nr:hypothetical protein [Pseudonocardia sp.]HTF53530.1 hypothetical protein [Pseudonocardia sp.]
MSLEDLVQGSMSRTELTRFIDQLADSFVEESETWENDSLERFLRAWAVWLFEMDGYFKNIGQPVPESPSWQLIAQMLLAARVYE